MNRTDRSSSKLLPSCRRGARRILCAALPAASLLLLAVSASASPAPIQGTVLPAPETCFSERMLTIHALRHLHMPTGATLARTEVLLAGHRVATARGADPVAHVSLFGLPKGSYAVTIVSHTTRGASVRSSTIYHTCANGPVSGY